MSKLEFIFPLIAAVWINRKINKQENDSFETICNKWKSVLKDQSVLDDAQIEKISYNIYSDEDKRTTNIENKGSWLLIGVGLAISLLSIILGFSFEDNLSILQVVAIGFFLWSIFNLILAGIGAHQAMKTGQRYFQSTYDLDDVLSNKGNMIDWIANQLASVQSNYALIRQKSNLIDVSQQHFIRGLVFMVPGFGLLFYQTIFTIFDSVISS